MNKMLIPGAVVVIVIIAAAVFLMRGNQASPQQETTSPTGAQTQETIPTQAETSDTTTPASNIKEFKITASNFKFDVTEIKVNMGDTVRIVYTNAGGTHDWRLDEFSAKTNILDVGQSETVEFVADKTGEFEYYCSVGQHRKMGMKGMLIVE